MSSQSSPSPRLLLAIHDVSPRSEEAVLRLRALLARSGGGCSLALLVVPNYWGQDPIKAGSPFATRLRVWAERGDEIFLHGWFHRDESKHSSQLDRLRARWMTASEGEFLGLGLDEAGKRLRNGRALLEDLTGRPVAGFVAPAWLYGPRTEQALAELGFVLAEDHWRVWNPATGQNLAKGPVITWASRSAARIASSLAWARVARGVLARDPVVRIAVHPGDAGVPLLRRSIAATVGHFARRRDHAKYGDLLASTPETSPPHEAAA